MSKLKNTIWITATPPEVMAYLTGEDETRAESNRRRWADGFLPTRPEDISVGDLVMPCGEFFVQWQRGVGVVDRVDQEGFAWATFGQRANPHPSDAKTVRLRCHWNEVVVVERTHP